VTDKASLSNQQTYDPGDTN